MRRIHMLNVSWPAHETACSGSACSQHRPLSWTLCCSSLTHMWWAGIFLFLCNWESGDWLFFLIHFFSKSASAIKGGSSLAKLSDAMTALLFLISLRLTASCSRWHTGQDERMPANAPQHNTAQRNTTHIYLFISVRRQHVTGDMAGARC